MATRIVFITGTDTGVGKTVLTALLLAHGLRHSGSILAMKPFCSGGRQDPAFLNALQGGRLPEDLLNPFYFDEPIAPLASQRIHHRRVTLGEAERAIQAAGKLCDILLVEGSGGLLVPLGESFTVLDLILRLRPEVVVAARNRLGTINHTLLTAAALKSAGIKRFKTVLINTQRGDMSSKSNAGVLRELLAPNRLFSLPFLTGKLNVPENARRHAEKLRPVLRQILDDPG